MVCLEVLSVGCCSLGCLIVFKSRQCYHLKLRNRRWAEERIESYHRVMINEKPSSQSPHEPEMPPIEYPRGGMSVCLSMLAITQRNQPSISNNSPAAAMGIAEPLALPPQARQDLQAVDPEPGSQRKA